MPDIGFHFASPGWLLGLLVPPLVWLWWRFSRPKQDIGRFRAYADAQLLPHLLGLNPQREQLRWRPLALWTLLWSLLILAMAGPRWDFTDVQLFRPGSDVVILLDLSTSMTADDVAPSRLARARQEIEDFIDGNRQARVGLIAFASLAHIISPLTEDTKNLRRQLPALSTELMHPRLRGSRLTEALQRAGQMLAGQPADSSRHLILITDGDFGDDSHLELLPELAAKDVRVHVLGIGTEQGATVAAVLHRPVVSRLEAAPLEEIARLGNGIYQLATYDDDDTARLLAEVGKTNRANAVADEKTRVWNERFFWLVMLGMLLLLTQFRRVRDPSVRPFGGGIEQ